MSEEASKSGAVGAGGAGRRPCEEAAAEPEKLANRRRFLTWLSVGLGGLAGLAAGVPVLGALLSPLRREPDGVWRVVGRVVDFRTDETVMVQYVDADPLPWAGYAQRSAAWLRREADDRFVAFSMYCTHTGCPVTWAAGAQMFMCPCHGGTFHRDGRVAAGPPPRPLEMLPTRVRDGQVEVRTIGAPRTG
jgi:menaquinol-cytochrome c reductase iron-sulfur subunit